MTHPRIDEILENLCLVKGEDAATTTTVIAGVMLSTLLLQKRFQNNASREQESVLAHCKAVLEGMKLLTAILNPSRQDIKAMAGAMVSDFKGE